MTPDDLFQFTRKNQAEIVDLKFVDILGSWQHCSYPVDVLDTGTFKEGLGFDGSSIRGWMGIHESDMLAVPDADTARLDPFFAKPTVSVLANIVDPVTGKDFSRDPRHIARKSEASLKESGIADTYFIGPEPEFFIFDEVRYEKNQHRGYYEIASAEGAWNTARIEEPNLGYKPSFKGGYFPVIPTDTYHDLRGEMVYEMRKIGIIVEAHHHEVATAGQSEIDMQFQPLCCKWPISSCGTSTSARTSRSLTARRSRSCRSRFSRTTAAACIHTCRCGRAESRCSPATGTQA